MPWRIWVVNDGVMTLEDSRATDQDQDDEKGDPQADELSHS